MNRLEEKSEGGCLSKANQLTSSFEDGSLARQMDAK